MQSSGDTLDLGSILTWSTGADVDTRVANLTARTGELLPSLVASWIGSRAGGLQPVIVTLISDGRVADLVPLGLVARAVDASAGGSGPRALFQRDISGHPTSALVQLAPWADAAETVTRRLIGEGKAAKESVSRLLNRSDALLSSVDARDFAAESAVLRRSLTQRLAALGDTLFAAADRARGRAPSEGPDGVLVDPDVASKVEAAWSAVDSHALARRVGEVRVQRARAGVQLVRWLARPTSDIVDLAEGISRFWTNDAWVDRAVADAWAGVEDEELARGLRGVLAAARTRRDAHDVSFAAQLVRHEASGAVPPAGVCNAEDLLRSYVLPLAARQPVLFVLADGMSCSVASEVVDDITTQMDTWLECVPDGSTTRVAAIAAYPTLTKLSRASLFAGELTTGEQVVERAGFERLTKSTGVAGRLFHKLTLDSSEPGFSLAHDVATAVDDPAVQVVACVLNTIDDALDRSDPGGIEWSAESVKHLRPLLEKARRAGRVVVIASDHGHVVERREGRLVTTPDASSNRSHGYSDNVGPGEVRITGRRVLDHNGDAVLAVDERLRYGPLKAGYHGGASPAEVVIPVCVLTTGGPPSGWRLAPPQAPAWWRAPSTVVPPGPVAVTRPSRMPAAARDESPTLFDPEPASSAAPDLVSEVLASVVYREQRNKSANRGLSDELVSRLLRALLAAPAHRLDPESAAAALDVAVVQLGGALPQVQRLLNVEQYPVISRDVDGASIVLDAGLLREQFEESG